MSLKQHLTHFAGAPVAYFDDWDCLVNLAGDYSYLGSGYYASQDIEVEGKTIYPTCKDVLDGYVVPLFLEKARLAGLPVPTYYVTNDYFEPPVLVDTINPFMDRQSVVLREGRRDAIARSLTRNYTYAVCCQELPLGSRIAHFRAVLGWSASPKYRNLAEKVWDVFRMPLAEARVITTQTGDALLSALRPLPCKKLSLREVEHLNRAVKWQT